MTSGLWLGTVTAELYYSAGWIAVPFVNMTNTGYNAAVSNYVQGIQHFQPHLLGRFGNARLVVKLTNNDTLRGRAWYDADTNVALVVIVNGGSEAVSFNAKVSTTDPRLGLLLQFHFVQIILYLSSFCCLTL